MSRVERTKSKAASAQIAKLHDNASESTRTYLEQYAGREATDDEVRRLTVDADGKYPPQDLEYRCSRVLPSPHHPGTRPGAARVFFSPFPRLLLL